MNFSALPFSATASLSPVATISVRLFGSLSYALLSAMSIGMNCLLIAVLSYGHYQFRRMAFFTLAWQMIVCDLMAQSIQMIVAVPVTFAGKAVYGHPFWYYALLFLDTVAYNATLHFSALLTINRLGVFFLPRINELLFSYPNIFKTVAFLWLYVFVFCSCYIIIGLSTYLPVFMLLSYLIIFVYFRYFFSFPKKVAPPGIKTAAKEAEEYLAQIKRKQELKFLIQSFIICGFLEVQNLAFDWAPTIFSSLKGQWSFLVTFSENWISILLNSISPIILFSFNTDVRKCLQQLLRHFLLAIPPSPNRQPPAAVPVQRLKAITPVAQIIRPRQLLQRPFHSATHFG
uniref:7TM GPCR serpentine receptor class x (Srx) domain-containing protein n=1 Tax=Globodera rostochiensis TaxID=31243 RepID=A0A914IDZ6_GLORO